MASFSGVVVDSFGPVDGRISLMINRLLSPSLDGMEFVGGLDSRLAPIISIASGSVRTSSDRISSIVSLSWAMVSSIVFDWSTTTADRNDVLLTDPDSTSASSEW